MLSALFDPSNYYFNPYAVPVLIVGFLTVGCGLIVFVENRTGVKNKRFLIGSLILAAWLFFASLNYFSKNSAVANFWYKYFAYNAVLLLPAAAYFLNLTWIKTPQKIHKIISFVFIIPTSAIILINSLSDKIIAGSRMHFYGYYPTFDIFGIVSYFGWGILLVLQLIVIISEYKKTTSPITKNQLKFIILGYLVATFGVIDFLPAAFPREIYTAGYLFTFMAFVIWMYAVIRYRAMDVETIIHKTVLWVLSSLAIIIPLFLIFFLFFKNFAYLDPVSKVIIVLVSFYIFRWYNNKTQAFINRVFRRRSYDYYEKLISAVEEISSELDLDHVVKKIVEKTNLTIYPEHSTVLIRGDNGYLSKNYSEATMVLSFSHPLAVLIENEKKAVEVDDIKTGDYYGDKNKIISWFKDNNVTVLVPFVLKNKIVGLLLLGRKTNLKPYTLNDLGLLESFGKQIGPALYNAIHHEALLLAFVNEMDKAGK